MTSRIPLAIGGAVEGSISYQPVMVKFSFIASYFSARTPHREMASSGIPTTTIEVSRALQKHEMALLSSCKNVLYIAAHRASLVRSDHRLSIKADISRR